MAGCSPDSSCQRRFLKELFGLNCDDEHLIAYFDNSAQLAMRAKATYIGCVAKLTSAKSLFKLNSDIHESVFKFGFSTNPGCE